MIRGILFAVFGCLLALSGQAQSKDEKTTLQDLLAENQNLSVQLDKAKKTEGQIAKAGLTIEGAQAALNGAQRELRTKGAALLKEAQQRDEQARQSGCPWGGSSMDKGFVASCNTEGARLNAWLVELKKQGGSIDEYARKLQQEQARLSEDTLKWAAKKKENNADLQELYDAQTSWQQRYNTFVFKSDAYERLKKMAKGSELCEQLHGGSSDRSMRNAADCLQRLWENAR
ncbi:MAG TPA: hypothetical protein VJS66_01755 [Burkholderiales bacterium]|nr:hypothetical protein [Burkholderiales bacterium]